MQKYITKQKMQCIFTEFFQTVLCKVDFVNKDLQSSFVLLLQFNAPTLILNVHIFNKWHQVNYCLCIVDLQTRIY